MSGLTLCYYTDASHATIYSTGQVDLADSSVDWSGKGYRLPTEAEWERAARGGTSSRFWWGTTISEHQANYLGYIPGILTYDLAPEGYNAAYTNGGYPYTSPVGSFAANGFGLNDMAGNLLAWCWDWWDGSYYSSSPDTDPHGPISSPGGQRVMRGGSWGSLAIYLRPAYRGLNVPTIAGNNLGFRCVRIP